VDISAAISRPSYSANERLQRAGPDARGRSAEGPSPEEQREIEKLKARDREVRAHEAAHLAAAGGHARSGASFSYQRGPDGVLYAVGGEVSIDTSPVPGDPQATLAKALQVQRAALAPADPSAQDRQVAAQAAAMAIQARRELAAPQEEGEGAGQALERRFRDSGALPGGAMQAEPALHLIA